jgi:hypothetical protein
MAIELNGKRRIKDGPETKFRCFAASQEVLYKNTYKARLHNLLALKSVIKSVSKLTKLILDSLPKKAKYVRVHVSGDFFTQNYFDAWMAVARAKPNVLFYAYTKSLPFWAIRKQKIGPNLWQNVDNTDNIPHNFVLTASIGGKYDSVINTYNLRSARVVYSEAEAANLGLEIDHDDSLAMTNGGNFALLLHGTQPVKSEAAKAWTKLRKAGKSGYNVKKRGAAKLPVLVGK